MKKLICLLTTLILVFCTALSAFADGEVYRIDSFTGEVIDSATGDIANYVVLASDVTYDRTTNTYVYVTSSIPDSDVACDVFDGTVTTDPVGIYPGPASLINVFRDGEPVLPVDYGYLSEPGSYTVRNASTDTEIFGFTIVNRVTSVLYSYRAPVIFNVTDLAVDGESVIPQVDVVDMSEDGHYLVTLYSASTSQRSTLSVTVDHTYPVLEIFGVDEEGYADGPVSFGPTEDDSVIEITCNGEPVSVSDVYKTAGSYVVKYTDEAGNTSSYYFTIKVFFDAGAWVWAGLVIAIILLTGGYMIYSRKHMRTR